MPVQSRKAEHMFDHNQKIVCIQEKVNIMNQYQHK